MSASVLISGELFRDPERKTSSSGKAFVKATIKTTAADNSAEFWSCLIFAETAAAEIMELRAGERLAAQGQMKLEIFNGRIQRTIFAGAILPLRQKKKRKDKPDTTKPTSTPPTFDDPIPF